MSIIRSSCNTRFNFLFVFSQCLLISAVTLGSGFIVPGGSEAAAESRKMVSYQPPKRGAPLTRVAGGSRGSETSMPNLFVLTPEHTGLTQQAHPVLYWYTSKPIDASFEFALINDDNYQILVDKKLRVAARAGIYSVPLKDLNVSLEPGVPYQWSVAIVTDKQQRSGDIFSSGTIERVAPGKLSARPNGEEDAVIRYAEAGLWYDALDAASDLIAKNPGEKRFIEQRAALLEQVGLNEVAAHEMGRSR